MYVVIESLIILAIFALFLSQKVSITITKTEYKSCIQFDFYPFKLLLQKNDYNKQKKKKNSGARQNLSIIFTLPRIFSYLLRYSEVTLNTLSLTVSEDDPYLRSFKEGGIYTSFFAFVTLLYLNSRSFIIKSGAIRLNDNTLYMPKSSLDLTIECRLFRFLFCFILLISEKFKRRKKNVGKQDERYNKGIFRRSKELHRY